MKTLLKLGSSLAVTLTLCAGAQGQSRGVRVPPFRISNSAGAAMGRVMPQHGVARTLGRQVVVLNDSQAVSFDPILFPGIPAETFAVPGLGFDFVHFAATHPGFRHQSFIQPLTPIIPIGLPFFASPSPQIVIVQQPPMVIMQPSAPAEEDAEPVRTRRRAAPEESAAPAPPAPPREVGEFVLVRRDGRLLLAVAFSTDGKQVNYVTREGIRRSVPLAELDLEATQQQNEERGTSLRLPVQAPQPVALPLVPRQSARL